MRETFARLIVVNIDEFTMDGGVDELLPFANVTFLHLRLWPITRQVGENGAARRSPWMANIILNDLNKNTATPLSYDSPPQCRRFSALMVFFFRKL